MKYGFTDQLNLLSCLEELAQRGPRSTLVGICSNVPYGCGRELQELFRRWPKNSGEEDYPVPCPLGGTARDAYDVYGDMWVGAYGDLRRELLAFCIEELRKEI